MAPIKHPEWPDVPNNREDFLEDVQNFHRERGTLMDPIPKVSTVPIDLYELFQIVQNNGGYDSVSQQKLQWRRLAEEHWRLGGGNNAAAYAFQLKSLFYRNLAAYAITRVYKQDPPPKEILEHITAKGANLLNRTLESWRKEQTARGKPVEQSEESGSEHEPASRADKMQVDDSGARGTRLRQAPPQRQFFQPDISSTRQPRQVIQQIPSPQPIIPPPQYNIPLPPIANINSAAFQIGSWEGRNLNAGSVHVRPVPTPSNNSTAFKEKIRRIRETQLAKMGRQPETRPPMHPGTGYAGPNIFMRCLMSLRCGIPAEQNYALFHLLRISHDRGDRFRFEQFPGLSDGLINIGLELASTFYDVQWSVSYVEDPKPTDPFELDGLYGTSDLLERIANLTKLPVQEDIISAEYGEQLRRGSECALIIRNMCLLEENAQYMSQQTHLGDLLTIWLNLPKHDWLVELQHNALEIAEQLTRYWTIAEMPTPLYATLIRRLDVAFDVGDRGSALTILRTLTHIGTYRGEESQIVDISPRILQRFLDWLLLDDDELLITCIDFLYRYLSRAENTAFFLQQCAEGNINHEHYLMRLLRLMWTGARKFRVMLSGKPHIPAKEAVEIAPMPDDLKEELQDMAEPGRSSAWLRAFFEENAESEIKQIALWQAYQGTFINCKVPLLAAAEFIKNVSATFTAANAQVINTGATPKFIIKGIRYRHAPVSPKGQTYLRCNWTMRKMPPADVAAPPTVKQELQTSGPQTNAAAANGHAPSQQANGTSSGVPVSIVTSTNRPASSGGVHQQPPPAATGTVQAPGTQLAAAGLAAAAAKEGPCGTFHSDPSTLYKHICTEHIGLQPDVSGESDDMGTRKPVKVNGKVFSCKWQKCRRFSDMGGTTNPFEMAKHVLVHLPDTSEMGEHRAKHTKRKRPDVDEEVEQPAEWPAEAEYVYFHDTPMDARGNLANLPVNCTLVLRMLARTVPKAVAYMQEQPHNGRIAPAYKWMQMLFSGIWEQLWELVAHNRTLAGCIFDVAYMVERGMEEEEGVIPETI